MVRSADLSPQHESGLKSALRTNFIAVNPSDTISNPDPVNHPQSKIENRKWYDCPCVSPVYPILPERICLKPLPCREKLKEDYSLLESSSFQLKCCQLSTVNCQLSRLIFSKNFNFSDNIAIKICQLFCWNPILLMNRTADSLHRIFF